MLANLNKFWHELTPVKPRYYPDPGISQMLAGQEIDFPGWVSWRVAWCPGGMGN